MDCSVRSLPIRKHGMTALIISYSTTLSWHSLIISLAKAKRMRWWYGCFLRNCGLAVRGWLFLYEYAATPHVSGCQLCMLQPHLVHTRRAGQTYVLRCESYSQQQANTWLISPCASRGAALSGACAVPSGFKSRKGGRWFWWWQLFTSHWYFTWVWHTSCQWSSTSTMLDYLLWKHLIDWNNNMLLSPIPFVPSDKSEGLNFNFHTPHPGVNAIRLVFTAVLRVSVFIIALFTALSGQGYWGQGIGKTSLSYFEERFGLTQLGCLLVVVYCLSLMMVVVCWRNRLGWLYISTIDRGSSWYEWMMFC